ncbi:hypothetical protein LEP48_12025 [Isoptericola sp. NEAU-Y5]|uniref:Uncharacterized protein n=1 Tax=Isoptericola luteus TaxID=2879484 RepID=A0ABS7ZGC6_9MICO|nr:hypothetical protein [Isoptericola sp. NEAU-Y5]MCA5894070.1 hypothetical protein [Isoptericola sp. NEAU-Y5]
MSDFQVNPRTKSEPSGIVFGRFLLAFVLFVAGLVLIGSGSSGGNETLDPYLFVGGLVAIGLAFGLPMIGAHERG